MLLCGAVLWQPEFREASKAYLVGAVRLENGVYSVIREGRLAGGSPWETAG
jgi:hypothetical protein